MNERIREIRKDYGLTAEKFAERIGLKRSAVTNIEIGANAATDRVITAICQEFRVNEEWLRTGTGAKYKELSRYDEIAELTKDLLHDEPDSFRVRFVSALAKLDMQEWRALEKIATNLADENKNNV